MDRKFLVKTVYLAVLICLVAVPVLVERTDDGLRLRRWSGVSAPRPLSPVPYLDSRPSEVDGQGTATVSPGGPLSVGEPANFEIVFTVGEAGISRDGFVFLQVSPWWGWSPPQMTDPTGRGFTEVETSFTAPHLHVEALPMNRVLVSSPSRGFLPGDRVTFRYGRGATVDRFAEEEELFQVFVDADGDGHSACIQSPPSVRIVAGPPASLVVTVPPQAVPRDVVNVRLAPVDRLGNWSRLPACRCQIRMVRDGEVVQTGSLDVAEGTVTATREFSVPGEGVYFFEVSGPGGLEGRSNVMLCLDGARSLNLYFGDIHGHSRLSDGTGTPEAFYRYARYVSGLDIAALTDHSDFGTVPVRGDVWDRIVNAANDAYVPGEFVTFVGFEWTNWTYGHRNVYYRDGRGPVFRALDPESNTPERLWACLEPHEAMTVAHHVGGGALATDWDVVPGPLEWLVEICSVQGVSEAYGVEASVDRPVKGAFVRDALARGYRLGFIGSGDTHDGHPGQKSQGALTGGTLGVYSPSLTREAVWEAFRQRRVYATSGPRMILNFRVADSPMGSAVTWPAGQGVLQIAVRAVGCDIVEMVEIVRDGEVVARWTGNTPFMAVYHEDPVPSPGVHTYYARVTQRDRNRAWSSPVWVDVE